MRDEKLLKHELCHVQQYRQHGFAGFLEKYLWESIRKGYYNNAFEVVARKAEPAPPFILPIPPHQNQNSFR